MTVIAASSTKTRCVGNAHPAGASGSSTQSNRVSSPAGCSMNAFGRFGTREHAVQAAQLAVSNLSGQGQLVHKRRHPEMRVLSQPRGEPVDELLERVRFQPSTQFESAVASEVRADRLAVVIGAVGDLTDRQPLSCERVNVYVVLL